MLTIFASSVNYKRALNILFFIIVLVTLTACSPHPGAGKWKADKANELNVSIINVLFEGTADFYTEGKDESIRRCFWSAIAPQTMSMQCVYSDNTDKKAAYQFVVTDKGHATLSQDEQVIGLFTLQKPEKEASFF
ncbi:hypothetical protein [sulfur-oxidizing endosymbiont of Gigantopelta aegis]|uniref:hypothetical protein n=1 Tax=sulfur-oxidizing endosymbiont of Gigantopelta aegis TaxID=2794934 RepID=UPI0018DB7C3E|nr:hypothetical protein [sulfur-oxidizing endosymbiont of Gigantopelta aegis]